MGYNLAKKKLKKFWLLSSLAFVFIVPQTAIAQSPDETIQVVGTGIGVISKIIDNSVQKRREQQDREEQLRREDEELRMAVEAETRRNAERAEKARQQKEMERQSSESNNSYSKPSYTETKNVRTSASNVSTKSHNSYSNSVNKNRSFNSNAKTLSSINSVVFLTDEGEYIFLLEPLRRFGEGSTLSYNNHSNKERHLSCDRAIIKIKYEGDNTEQTFTSACSFVMPAHSTGRMEWSDVFPNLSTELSDTYAIKSIKVCFVDTQIK